MYLRRRSSYWPNTKSSWPSRKPPPFPWQTRSPVPPVHLPLENAGVHARPSGNSFHQDCSAGCERAPERFIIAILRFVPLLSIGCMDCNYQRSANVCAVQKCRFHCPLPPATTYLDFALRRVWAKLRMSQMVSYGPISGCPIVIHWNRSALTPGAKEAAALTDDLALDGGAALVAGLTFAAIHL